MSGPLGAWKWGTLALSIALSGACAVVSSPDATEKPVNALRTEEKAAGNPLRPPTDDGTAATNGSADFQASPSETPAPESANSQPSASPSSGKPTTVAIRTPPAAGSVSAAAATGSKDNSVVPTAAALPAATPPSAADSLPLFVLETPSNAAGREWTMEEVLQHTLQNNPTLRVRQQEIQVARSKLITAGLLPNPRWVFNANSPLVTGDDSALSTRVEFTIPTGPKRRLLTEAEQAAVRQSQLALSAESRVVLLEASDAAIEVLYFQELASQQRQLASLADKVSTIQKERFKVAGVPYRGVVVAELTARNAELALRSATAKLDQAQVRLARAMGLAPPAPLRIRGQVVVQPVPPVPLTAVLDRASKVAPELARAEAAIRASERQLAFERWRAVPDLTLAPTLQESLNTTDNHRVGGRIETDIPLFDRNQGNIAGTAAQVEVNRALLRAAKVATLSDVAAAYHELKDAQSRWDYYSASAKPVMDQSEKAIREAFQDMTISAYELAELLVQFGRMQLTELDLRYEHHRLRTRLEVLLECKLPELAAEPILTPPAEPVPGKAVPAAANRP